MTAGPDNVKVIRQVEYYFGDSNLSRDKFLQDEIKKNEGGWIPLETMLKVNICYWWPIGYRPGPLLFYLS